MICGGREKLVNSTYRVSVTYLLPLKALRDLYSLRGASSFSLALGLATCEVSAVWIG